MIDPEKIDDAARAALAVAVAFIQGEVANRVFEQGKDSRGGSHSYNDTNEIWVQDTAMPKGKQNRGKAGRAEKTSYFTSYKAYVSAMGRDATTANVNLQMTNELQSDFRNTLVVGEDFVATAVKNPENAAKIDGNNKRFNTDWFSLSDAERERYNRVFSEEFHRRLRQ